MTTGISVETIVSMLNKAILDKDAVRALAIVIQLKEAMRIDPIAVKWITDPANLKSFHENLNEHLGVPQKMMMIRNRIPHRQKRAHLFAMAIENGIRKVISE